MKIQIVNILILLSLCSAVYPQVDINNKIMLAQSFEQAGDYDKAAALFEEIYSIQPQNYQIFESLNRIYVQSKKYEKSITLIEARIITNPQDVNLYGMLGTTYYLIGDEKKAFDTWEIGINISPDNAMQYRIIANFAIQRRAFDKAIDYLRRGKALAQNPDVFSYDLANLYSLSMRYKEAAEECCFLLSLQPTQLSSIENRILSYSNKPSALSQTIEAIENWKDKDNISFDYLLARLYVEAKSFEKAHSLYLKIDQQQQNKGQELYNFAQLVFGEGEYALAAKIFEEIIKKYPDTKYSSASRLGYAKSLEAILENEINKEAPTWKPVSKPVVIDSQKTKNVVSSYLDLVSLYPNSDIAFESYFRIGEIYFTKLDKIEEAKKYFEKVVKESPLSRFAIESSQELGKIFLLEGNITKAEESFEWIANNNRASEESRNLAIYNLARLDFYEGNFETAKNRLGKIITNLKDNSANDAIELSLLLNTASSDSSNLLKFAQAEFLTDQRRFSEAAALYRNIAKEPNAFILHHICKISEAEVELAMDSLDTSIELLTKISDEAEKNIYADKALYLLGKIYYYGKKNYPKAMEVFESLLAKFPNSLYQDDSRNAIIELRNKLS